MEVMISSEHYPLTGSVLPSFPFDMLCSSLSKDSQDRVIQYRVSGSGHKHKGQLSNTSQENIKYQKIMVKFEKLQKLNTFISFSMQIFEMRLLNSCAVKNCVRLFIAVIISFFGPSAFFISLNCFPIFMGVFLAPNPISTMGFAL